MEYDDYSNSTETWDTEEHYPWPLIVMNLLQGVATTTGLLANALLLFLFAVTPRQRTVSGTLLLQRAIADVIALVPFPFIIYDRAKTDFKSGQAMCTSLNIFLHVGVVASDVFLMAFTLDCYQASYPQHHTLSFRRKTMRLTSTVAWVLAAAAGVAAYFFGYLTENGYCTFGPLFHNSSLLTTFMQLFALFVLPMVIVWVLVSVALPPRHSEASAELKAVGEGGPNRRLLLGVSSSFTVVYGLYCLGYLLGNLFPFRPEVFIFIPIASALSLFGETINAILVICLSEDLRQKVAGWLPSRLSASVPLQDL